MKKIILFTALLMASCATVVQPPVQVETNAGLPAYVHRFVDEEAGVVCWTYSSSEQNAAMDCMPASETLLK